MSMTGRADDAVTWVGLMAQWMEYARASMGWPRDLEGDRHRASVEHVITLQATIMAVEHLHQVDQMERILALDRAQVGVQSAVEVLQDQWNDQVPANIHSIVVKAMEAIDRTRSGLVMTMVWNEPFPLEMPLLQVDCSSDPRSSLSMVPPGTVLGPGTPIAWWTGGGAPPIPFVTGCIIAARLEPLQLWRSIDLGCCDRVESLQVEPECSIPMLAPLLIEGRRNDWPVDPDSWINATTGMVPPAMTTWHLDEPAPGIRNSGVVEQRHHPDPQDG